MRISDWSSDVCSSDLKRRRIAGVGREILEIERPERHRAVEPGAAASLVDGDVAGEIGPADRALEAGNAPLGPATLASPGDVVRLLAIQPPLYPRLPHLYLLLARVHC